MKKSLLIIAILCFGLVGYSAAQCVTLKDGNIYYSSTHYLAGQLIKPGFDDFGYNYQAHIFNGYYVNAYYGGYGLPPYDGTGDIYFNNLTPAQKLKATQLWPYREDMIVMKWNDPWLANRDCDGDGKLDRHNGYLSYIGSEAWETNHQSGTYLQDGKEYRWTYFCKIIAAPADAYKTDGIWYTVDGKEIGPDIWGEFALIEEVYNDQHQGYHGVLYKSPTKAGFGDW